MSEVSEDRHAYRLKVSTVNGSRHVKQVVQDSSNPHADPAFEVWKEVRKLGEGAQGDVFLQEREVQKAFRAVKAVRCGSNRKKNQCIRELQIMAKYSQSNEARTRLRVEHYMMNTMMWPDFADKGPYAQHSDYFVQLFGYYYSADKQYLYIAMEYMPAGDLKTYMNRHKPLYERDTQEIISQVLTGLIFMHEGGHAHRDIKAENILIKRLPSPEDRSWWVKLSDFGISKRIDTETKTTVAGTLRFKPPELREGSIRSEVQYEPIDMWTVGALAFYLLTKDDRGFYQWRRKYFEDSSNAKLPGSQEISADGLRFILQITAQKPEDRLSYDNAWVTKFVNHPLSTMSDHRESPSTLSTKSFTTMSELSTLATRVRRSGSSGHFHPSLGAVSADFSRDATQHGLALPMGDDPLLPDHVAGVPGHAGSSNTTGQTTDSSGTRNSAEHGRGALYDASVTGDEATVRRLTRRGVDATRPYPDQNSDIPIFVAASNGHLNVVRLLTKRGADFKIKNKDGMNALHIAAKGGHLRVVEHLVSSGADIMTRDKEMQTALHMAAIKGHLDVADFLIKCGANIMIRDMRARTALHYAAEENHRKLVEHLNCEFVAKTLESRHTRKLVNKPPGPISLQMPPSMSNFTSWKSRDSSLGDRRSQSLYRISKKTVDDTDCKFSPYIFLQYDTWTLAVGGEVSFNDFGPSTAAPLASVFQIVADDDSSEDGNTSHKFHILHADLASESNMVSMCFSMDKMLQSTDTPSTSSQPDMRQFAWKEIAGMEPSRSFHLVPLSASVAVQEGSETLPGGIARNEGSPGVMASLVLAGPWNKSGSFRLQIREPLSHRGYLTTVITALVLWSRNDEGHMSREYFDRALEEAARTV